METKDRINQLIESAIDQVLALNAPSFEVCDVSEILLTNNPLLSNAAPDNLDRKIEMCLAVRFDPIRRAEIVTEDFLNGRPESALRGAELEAYIKLQRRLGEELIRHGEALEAHIANHDGGAA